MGNRYKPAHHRGTHQQTSYHLRKHWTANPNTQCAHCGLTLTQGSQLYGVNGSKWEADHINPHDPTAGYQPAHAHCNRSAGATHGNTNRKRPTW